ncbi:hypothetical protein N7516_010007 [Penicillium verrucosum]|uniref:uncharacterized protein n=1 Tax=Penicillium verrucosum TaxID=60171 RepID=UPI0025459EC5|nr:uncharacterized protein N7516_010007 [Penicillium verrucosum]KAJ5922304.1 hypothetical protein N7516_010007 [Penicillium verrucosum]
MGNSYLHSLCTGCPTDLIEHSIDLIPNALPVKAKLPRLPRYIQAEKKFTCEGSPDTEEAGVLAVMSSQWGARIRFLGKEKGSIINFRIVSNFIPISKWTIGNAYPVHSLDEVIDIILKRKAYAISVLMLLVGIGRSSSVGVSIK